MKKLLAIFILILNNLYATDVPVIHAIPQTNKPYNFSTGEMGIYRNLKDFVGFSLKASSYFNKSFNVDKLNDNNLYTAWINKSPNAGINEYIEFQFKEIHFTKVFENKKKSINWDGFRILNGYCKDDKLWQDYARVMAFKIYHNNKLICIVKLFDTTSWQEVKLPYKIKIKPNDKIKFKIIDHYPQELDKVRKKVAITEIQLTGDM